jgi:hypothetical protein
MLGFSPTESPATICEFMAASPLQPPQQHCVRVYQNMLYLVGLGLADEKDITVKGLEIVKMAERVYLEAYTAVLLVEKDVLVSEASRRWLGKQC